MPPLFLCPEAHNLFSASRVCNRVIPENVLLATPPRFEIIRAEGMAFTNGSNMLVWTVCAHRKPAMGEEEFHRYMSEVHAPLVREALERHGITRYSMTHITASTRHLTQKLIDAQFINEASYDIITQIRFPNIQCFIDFRNDPFYKEKVKADHDVFTDPGKVVMSVGWVEDHIIDGKVVA